MAYFNARVTAKEQAALQEAAGMIRALLLAFRHEQPERSPFSHDKLPGREQLPLHGTEQ